MQAKTNFFALGLGFFASPSSDFHSSRSFHRITFKPHLPRYQLLVHRSLHAGDAGILGVYGSGRIDFLWGLWSQWVSAGIWGIEVESILGICSRRIKVESAFRRLQTKATLRISGSRADLEDNATQ